MRVKWPIENIPGIPQFGWPIKPILGNALEETDKTFLGDARRRKDRCREQGCCCLRLEPRKSLGSDVLRSQGDFEFFISSNSVQSA